jgi:hypothetical protein
MIAAVAFVSVVAVLIAGALVYVVGLQGRERQHWADERRALVDRIIAHHAGEVIALDRSAQPKAARTEQERPQAVGL